MDWLRVGSRLPVPPQPSLVWSKWHAIEGGGGGGRAKENLDKRRKSEASAWLCRSVPLLSVSVLLPINPQSVSVTLG